MNKDFSFKLMDKSNPADVVLEYAKELNMQTRDYVTCHVEEYSGTIEDPKTAGEFFGTSLFDMNSVNQEELGEVGKKEYKYEVFLTIKYLDYYKYRICFMKYYSITYPIRVFIDNGLKGAIKESNSSIIKVESEEALKRVFDELFSSEEIRALVQRMIYESLRIESKES